MREDGSDEGSGRREKREDGSDEGSGRREGREDEGSGKGNGSYSPRG